MPDKIRIKKPQKSPSPQSPEPTSRRTSTAVKRRVFNSDEDDAEVAGVRRPVAKRARRRSYSAADSMDVDGDSASEMDVPESSGAAAARTVKAPASGKKRRAAVFSSDEEEDDDDDSMDVATQSTDPRQQGSSPLAPQDLSDRDYDHDLPAARSKPVRQKTATWKVRDAGGPAGNGGPKAKAAKADAGGTKAVKTKPVKKESKETLVKDERKKTKTPPVIASAPKTQARAQSKESQSQSRALKKKETKVEDVPVDDPAPPSSPPFKKEEPSPPPALPKKTKYPTIKKNKVPGPQTQTQVKPPPPASSSTTAAATAGAPDKADVPSAATATTAAAAGAPRKTPATADFDLRDKSAWASIFKQTGGSTPRTGLTRREKEEERKKELYKMRDEARAKREESLKQTFDLQASWDKISRFEERLRANRSSALYPNLFAAKFRDEWEMERKRARQREWEQEMEERDMERDVMMKEGERRGYV